MAWTMVTLFACGVIGYCFSILTKHEFKICMGIGAILFVILMVFFIDTDDNPLT